MTRQVYTPRGWGYNQNITGAGNLDEQVAVDSTTHYNTLQTKLANETNGATGEIKNGAVFTPAAGVAAIRQDLLFHVSIRQDQPGQIRLPTEFRNACHRRLAYGRHDRKRQARWNSWPQTAP